MSASFNPSYVAQSIDVIWLMQLGLLQHSTTSAVLRQNICDMLYFIYEPLHQSIDTAGCPLF